jgi:hypothetical protein
MRADRREIGICENQTRSLSHPAAKKKPYSLLYPTGPAPYVRGCFDWIIIIV